MVTVKEYRYRLMAFYKRHSDDKVWWTRAIGRKGSVMFSFDRVILFNFWKDYPVNLTAEQKAVFDKENPEWVKFWNGEYEPLDYEED